MKGSGLFKAVKIMITPFKTFDPIPDELMMTFH